MYIYLLRQLRLRNLDILADISELIVSPTNAGVNAG
jgi:hypothetical protein